MVINLLQTINLIKCLKCITTLFKQAPKYLTTKQENMEYLTMSYTAVLKLKNRRQNANIYFLKNSNQGDSYVIKN